MTLKQALKRAGLAVALSALVPTALLMMGRIEAESRTQRVAVVIDEAALMEQAALVHTSPLELAERYAALGATAVAVYEETPETLAATGRIDARLGRDLLATGADVAPEDVARVAGGTLVRERAPGALDALLAQAAAPPAEVRVNDQRCFVLPGDVMEVQPAGPPAPDRLAAYRELGLDVAYRPRAVPQQRAVGLFFPEEASLLIHEGQALAGYPHAMGELIEASQDRVTAFVENTPQAGFAQLQASVPTARLLSFEALYQNRRLDPGTLADKYLLGAEERNVRVAYVRPYVESVLGDLVMNTERLLEGLTKRLAASGFEAGLVAGPDDAAEDYTPSGALRAWVAAGIAGALVAFAASFPAAWGVFFGSFVLGISWLATGNALDTAALVAALVFPAWGYTLVQNARARVALATVVSLAGALMLVAVGSDARSILGLEPFRGVALTLVGPPALFAAWALLQERGPLAWLKLAWGTPIRLGPALLAGVAVAAVALLLIRRGNLPILGASELELEVREWLSTWTARPRFKELLGHPLGVLGFTQDGWPSWITIALMTGGVVAQSTILNSFSHYHTPVGVSFERTVVALAIGLAAGYVLRPLVRLVVRRTRAA